MKPLSDALDGWSPPRGGSPADPVVLLGAVWPEIVGDEVARCSHPVRLEAGTLTIVTRSSAWSQQLSLLSERVRSAIGVRLPAAGISELRFRVGKLPAPRRDAGAPAASVRRRRPRATRAPAADAAEALERFKESVMGRQRAKRAAGWKECRGCAALIAPDGAALCSLCANAQTRSRAGAAARLLFEAPWLGFRGTAALIEGLTPAEYGSI
ncbi:MAG TPA: DUF721 domain-containing protein, partial [Verrucomicrobiae bacterium]|nr:DUF721 domain-containing protein [Verrucomicrobiae bacterium]